MTEYTPTTDEGWALVDLLKDILEDAETQPKFTRDEHALMGAGQIGREWLAEHDAALVESLIEDIGNGTYTRIVSEGIEVAIDLLRARATEIREGVK